MSLRPMRGLAVDLDLEAGQLDRLDLPGERAADARLGLVALDRGEEADGAEVDAEDRDAGAGETAQRVEDRAVAAEHEAEVGLRRAAARPPRRPRRRRRAWRSPPRSRPGASRPRAATRDGDRDRFGRGRRVRVGDQGGGLHSLAAPTSRIAASRSSTCAPVAPAPDEGLAVALRPRQAGGGEAADRQAQLAGGARHGEDRLAPVGGVADDAPADPLAAELELRLDHRQHLAAGGQAARRPPAGSWPAR